MSDLLEQLRKRKQQEGGTGFKSIHVRPSLLFEYKEAAKIELTAIHLLAINGFEQLVKQEPRIKPFEQTLFAPASKEIIRESQTADVNKRLDESIDALLGLLSPYFLLKATHKCLEFLIRRYNIHEYNRDAVMKCILPFHQTNTFVRMVQLLRLKNTMWSFLEPVQKSGAAPSRKVLVERCVTDRSLAIFICNLVKESVASRTAYKQLFTFYTATILELLNMHDVNDSLVRDLWPFMIAGITSSNDGYQVSSLMLLSCLSWRVTLSPSLLSGAVLAIASRTLDHLHPKAVMTLLVLVQNAKSEVDSVLPEQAVELLIEWSDLPAILTELMTSTRQLSFTPLVEALLDKLVRMSASKPEVFKFLSSLVSSNSRFEKFVPKLVRDLLNLYNAHVGDSSSIVHSEEFSQLMKHLDSSFSTQFDQGIDQSLQGITAEPAWKQLFKDSRHQVVKNAESSQITTLQLCLRQSTPKLKIHALESLLKLHRKHGDDSSLGALLERTLLEHLSSDHEDVSLHALEIKGLEDVVDAHALFSQLQRLVMQGSPKAALAAIRTLVRPSYIKKDSASLTENSIPVLLTALLHRSSEVRTAALKDCEAYPHALFSSLKGEQAGNDHISKVISGLATAVAHKPADLHATLQQLMTTSGTQMKAVAFLIVGRAMAIAPSRQVVAALCRQVLPVISQEMSFLVSAGKTSFNVLSGQSTPGMPPCSTKHLEQLASPDLAPETAIYGSILLWSLENLILQISASGSYDENYVDILQQSFQLILSHPAMHCFQSHLQNLFAHLGKQSTRFLEAFWTSSNKFSSLEVVRSLNMCAALLFDGAPSATTLFDLAHLYVMTPGLLVPMTHSSMHVRVAAIQCLRGLHQVFSGDAAIQSLNQQQLPQKYIPLDQLASLVNGLVSQAASIQASQAQVSKMFEQKVSPSIQKFVLSRALQMPYRFAQVSLYNCLRHTPNSPKLAVSVPLLKALLTRSTPAAGFSYLDAKLFDLTMQLFAPDTASDLEKNPALFDLFVDSLSNMYSTSFDKRTEQVWQKGHNVQDRMRFCTSHSALASVTPAFFSALATEQQRKLFVRLCHLIIASPYYVREAVQSTLRGLSIPANLIQEELELLATRTEPASENNESSSKRRKGDAPKTERPADLIGRLTVILEMFQQRPETVLSGVILIPALFKLLGNIIEASSLLAQDPSSEYIEQLIFSAIIMVTQAIAHGLGPEPEPEKPKDDAMEVDAAQPAAPQKPAAPRLSIKLSSDELKSLEKHYSVDTIVRAIRARQNPTLHNSALLLLAQIARVFPQKVLANIMSVFSFMGASTQRSDDNYTFIVIQKTVERVIPALLSAEQKLDGSRVSTASLINVFVDRFDTIPTHRRLLLFTLILKILRGRSYLPYVLVHLFKRHQEHQMLEKQKSADGIVSAPKPDDAQDDETSVPSFSQSLLQKFSPHEAVSCLATLVALMNDARDQLESSSLANVNLTNLNRVQLMIDGVDFIAAYVVSKPFINQLVSLSTSEEEKIQYYLLKLFRNLLVLYARTTDQQKVSANAKAKADVSNWAEISERVYEALERVNDLLTINSFVQVIGSLLQHSDASIQQKALMLFNDKLTQQHGLIADSHISLFLQLTQQLFTAITADAADSSRAHLAAVNKQTAALTVEIVARQFGSNEKYTETFLDLARQVTQHLSAHTDERNSDSESAKVQSSMLVAIATLCSSLDQQLLPLLNNFFPAILNTLKSATTSMSGGSVDDNQRLLQFSALSSLQVIIRTLGRFLSTYMSDLLTSLLQPALLQFGEQMVQKVRAVLQLIAEHVRMRSLLTPLSAAYTTLKSSDASKSMCLLMDFAGAVAKHMTRADIQSNHKLLFGFFRLAFDYRSAVSPSTASTKKNAAPLLESILAVEDRIIASFAQFVLRLNEAMFKPLFISIIDWAQINNSAVLQSEAGYNPQRSLFFYRLLVSLADQLKSIFVPYYTYTVDHAVAILRNPSNDQTTSSHVDSNLLLSSVIAALHKCFLYDTEQWVDKDKFNKLMPALVDQLDNVRTGTLEQYRERVSRHLVPCLAQLAVAVNHDSLWKPLNYQVLLKTRSSNSNVRYSALCVVDELYHRLGEEFLVLLPESIQFFSELLEDSSEEVEELMLKFVKRVEDLLGEENGLMNLLQ